MPSPRRPRKVVGVENRERHRRDGTSYWTFRVRWVDPQTGERRGEEFDDQAEAIDFKAKLRLARRSGRMVDLDAGRETLAEFVTEWWDTYATVELEANTLKTYAIIWNRHVLPRLGHLQLRQIDPQVVARFRQALEDDEVGAPTIRTAMSILQGVLGRAVEWRRMQHNPVQVVRKPRQGRKLAVQPLAPDAVEALAGALPTVADQALVWVIAYAGLRPEEALALQWRHVRQQTMLIEQKNIDGTIVAGQKTKRPPRTVDLLRPLAQDLAAYRMHRGRPHDTAFVFARPDGHAWRETDYRNWRRRQFRTAAAAAGLTATQPPWNTLNPYHGPRPYTLRHSFASLRIHEGELSVAELADQLGHSVQMLLSTYTHVMRELKDQTKRPADQQIMEAREARRTA